RNDAIQPGLAGRLDGKVTPVGCPCEASGSARKRAGNDPSDEMLARQKFSSVAAEIPELFGWPDVFMAGDLKDGITRRVQDRPPCGQMLGAELRDDFGAGGSAVAEDSLARITLERRDDFRWKPVRVERKGPFRNETHHLPVAGRRVFSRGQLRRFAPRARELALLDQGEQPQPLEVRQRSRMLFQNVRQGVAARIAVGSRVRSFSDTQPVADE